MPNAITAHIGSIRLELVEGDITEQDVDAIVNAANSALMGGGGVDGAIHRAAGPDLLKATSALGGCGVGDAKITPGFNLKAKYVIHTVGPVYDPRPDSKSAEQLASAHRSSLQLATENNCTSVAFPAISTGVYRYPVDKAAEVALKTSHAYLASESSPLTLVRFVLFSPDAFSAFERALRQLAATADNLTVA